MRAKSKLTKYIQNPKHTQLRKFVRYDEDDNYDSAINLILKDFPESSLEVTPEDLVMELVSFLASIYEYVPRDMTNPDYHDVKEYITDSITYCEKLANRYHKEHDAARQKATRLSFDQQKGLEPAYRTKKERQELGYTLDMIYKVLEHQRINHNYYQYTDGYYYLRYKMYTWLLKELRQVKEDLQEEV